MQFVKGYNGTVLPRHFIVFLEKIKRTRFITRQWASATKAQLESVFPLNSRWQYNDETHKNIKWCSGEVTPKHLSIAYHEDQRENFGKI